MLEDGVVIVGAGGHAKVVIEILRSSGIRIAGLTDSNPDKFSLLGSPVWGDDGVLSELFAKGARKGFVALGDNEMRLEAGLRLRRLGFEIVNAISPRATISPSARLGRGIAVMPGATINAEARIDDFAIINTGAIVEHDAVIGLASHIGPGAALAGGVRVGEGAFVGIGASVVPGCTIGKRTIVGAGACVVGDLPEGVVAVGIPAVVARSSDRP